MNDADEAGHFANLVEARIRAVQGEQGERAAADLMAKVYEVLGMPRFP